jgi:ADP-heptose:LPS heptosyltransferase
MQQLSHQISRIPQFPRVPSRPAPVDLGPRPRICIVKLATLGDLLLATPALHALRERYPEATIDVLTTPGSAELLRDSQLVRRIFSFDKYAFDTPGQMLQDLRPTLASSGLLTRLRKERYDAALFLHHLTLTRSRIKAWALLQALAPHRSIGLDNGWGGFLDLRVPDSGFGIRHEAEYALEVARAAGADVGHASHPLRAADLGWYDLDQRTSPSGPAGRGQQPGESLSPQVALHPGSGSYSFARRWSAEHYGELAAALHREYGAGILLVTGKDEQSLEQKIRKSLGYPAWIESSISEPFHQLARRLSQCSLFVGNDSFPMHLAALVGIPTVGVFGPSNHQAWGPYRPDAPREVYVVRRSDLPCSPCFYRGHSLGMPQGCPPRNCLTELPVERVLWAARRLLEQHGYRPAVYALDG